MRIGRKDRKMERSKIINYTIQTELIPAAVQNTYRVKTPTKFKNWLIKVLFKLNILEEYFGNQIIYKRVQIDTDKITKLIRILYDDIYCNSGNKPRKVIIGFDKMRELELELYEEMRFDMPLELNGYEGRKVFGLEIVLNPRIDGLVLI